jgi:hypothetical protein
LADVYYSCSRFNIQALKNVKYTPEKKRFPPTFALPAKNPGIHSREIKQVNNFKNKNTG